MVRRIALALAALALAPASSAAVLPFESRLELELTNLSITIAGSGVATVNGSGGGLHLDTLDLGAGGLGGGPITILVTDPGAAPIVGLQLTVTNDAGHFDRTSGALGGVMGIPGVLKNCLFEGPGCGNAVANLSVPLDVIGAGGSTFVEGPVSLTVGGAPWTTGTASIGTFTTRGFAHGPATGTSTTAQPGGSIKLVTPIFIRTNIGVGVTLESWAKLTIEFVPEPTTLVLIGAGIAGLAWRGRRLRSAS
jgi:hypothetical protein